MKHSIEVENIKCGGCANSIKKGLIRVLENTPAEQIDINLESGTVSYEFPDNSQNEAIKAKLLKMGYPEKGSIEGLKAVASKAKSFASCAVGRMTNKV